MPCIAIADSVPKPRCLGPTMPLLMDGPRSTRMAPFYVVDSRRLERQIIRETTTDNERMDAAITIEMALIREERLTNLADTGIASKRGVTNAFIIFVCCM